MVKQTVRTYVALCILRNFAIGFVMAIYSPYLESKGLEAFDRNAVNASFFFWCLLMEMPTGALADIWGRKKCFVLSGIMSALCMFIYAKSTVMWHFLVAEFVSALGVTLASGAFFAWLTTRLGQIDDATKPTPESVQRKTYSTTCLTGIGASLISGWLGSKNYAWSWILCGTMLLVTSVCALLWIKEDRDPRDTPSVKEEIEHFRCKMVTGWNYAITHPTIQFILVMNLLMLFATQALNMLWPQFFKEQYITHNIGGFNELSAKEQEGRIALWSSYVWTAMMVFLAIGAQIGRWLDRRDKDERWLLMGSLVATGVGIIATVMMPTFGLTLALFLAHESARGMYRLLYDGYLNKQIEGEDQRATVLSVGTMPTHFASVVGLLSSGLIAQKTSISTSWLVSGFGLALAALCLIIWSRRRERETA